METAEKKVAKKVKILTEVSVECEPGSYATYLCRTEEERAKALESWCKEFNGFIRDHRHQDATQVSVRRVYTESCSACKAEWETMTFTEEEVERDDPGYEAGKVYCAHCGTEIAA